MDGWMDIIHAFSVAALALAVALALPPAVVLTIAFPTPTMATYLPTTYLTGT